MLVDQNTDYTQFNTTPYFLYFFDKGNVKYLIASFDPQHDDVEKVLFDINTETWLDTATGEQLDVLGRYIGLERNGRDDDTYRRLLGVKITINISSGEPETIIKVAKELYEATIVNYIPDYPAGIILQQNGTLSFFILTELVDKFQNPFTFANGEEWLVNVKDQEAEDLIFAAIPAGVSAEIQQI